MRGIPFNELELGQEFPGNVTITEAHLVGAAGLFGDFNPIHMNEEVAKQSVHGRRILHAPCVIGITMGTIGSAVAGTGIGDLEVSFKFHNPTCIGDTIYWTWKVTELIDKPKRNGGVAIFGVETLNQSGQLLMSGEAVILMSNEQLLDLTAPTKEG